MSGLIMRVEGAIVWGIVALIEFVVGSCDTFPSSRLQYQYALISDRFDTHPSFLPLAGCLDQ